MVGPGWCRDGLRSTLPSTRTAGRDTELPETLSDLFASAQRPVVEWAGAPAHALYEFEEIPESIGVEFVGGKPSPVQGLHIKYRGGLLIANDVGAEDLLLWRDTAPDRLTVRVEPRKKARPSLKIWNVWRGGLDVVQAWLGNAGMRVEVSPDGRQIDLHCSDGVGPVAFDDLQVRLTLT
jgi:hypothetical protein